MSEDFNSFNNQSPPSQPEEKRSIAKIAEALAKAQAEMIQPEKNKTVTVRTREGSSYTFDYADYNAIVESVRGPLTKHGICFTHLLDLLDGNLVLFTRLIHSSGEYLESIYLLPQSQNPKDLGGAITYGKRYCLSAITGCVADDDADAEPENVTDFRQRQNSPSQPQAVKNPSAAQLTRLFAIANERNWSTDEMKTFTERTWGVTSSKALTIDQYNALVDTVQNKTFAEACLRGSRSTDLTL